MGQSLQELQEELKETEVEIEDLQQKIEILQQKKDFLQLQIQEVVGIPGKVCPVCGYTELEEEARFCGNCGARLEKVDVEQSDEESSGPDKAPELREAQPICPFCGEALKPKARFCVGCGRVIREHSL